MGDLLTINSKKRNGRLVVAAIFIAALALAWFGVRWQIGSMLAELTTGIDSDAIEISKAAMTLAPGDPRPRWLAATKLRENFDAESLAESVKLSEDAVRLSPYDFRWWIELGRSYEQADRPAEAEKAFLRAVDLAPEFTFPQWQVGNFYLRQARPDDAFAHLRKTTEKSLVYRDQVFSLAWDYFEKDPAKVEQLAASTPEVRAYLALFFARRGATEDALRVWNTVPEEEKTNHQKVLSSIAFSAIQNREFRKALEFSKQAGTDPESAIGTIDNPGFEKGLRNSETVIFGWRISRGDSKFDAVVDSNVAEKAQRSLKLVFRNYSRGDLNRHISQIVAVNPLEKYTLTFSVRTENLKTGGEPLIEIVDLKNGVVIANSPRFPLGTNSWANSSVSFSTPAGSDGIEIRVTRVMCGEICGISGTVWLDSFELTNRT